MRDIHGSECCVGMTVPCSLSSKRWTKKVGLESIWTYFSIVMHGSVKLWAPWSGVDGTPRGIIYQKTHRKHPVTCLFLLFCRKIYAFRAAQGVHGVSCRGPYHVPVLHVSQSAGSAQFLPDGQISVSYHMFLFNYDCRERIIAWTSNQRSVKATFIVRGRILRAADYCYSSLQPFSAKSFPTCT